MPKERIVFFMSYARLNKRLATRFLEYFSEQASASKRYRYELWSDANILAGEDWHREIQNALAKCNLGLLLLSPAFLGSSYIANHELGNFVGEKASKPLIPVLLQPVDFEYQDLQGLDEKQIFRLDKPKFHSPKAFGECLGNQRNEFALQLFRHVEKRLGKLR